MKKTLIAIAAASAITATGIASAQCSFHEAHGYGTADRNVMTQMPARAGFIRTGGQQNMKASQPDIVDTAVAAGSFTTLVKAVQAAGLVETLKGDGPYTVFAPTDEAFAKLPPGTIEALLNDKEKLTKVLTYHVVPGKLDAKQVTSMSRLATVEGSYLPVASIDIASTDIMTSNGIIHVVNEVLIPQS
ncbi:MAG: fasciclin domain-containing protein [Sedimenticolaceae bacterium]